MPFTSLDTSTGSFLTAVKGQNASASYHGFRRTEFIAQENGSSTALDANADTGVSIFHFSIKVDISQPLNYSQKYQIVFIEPSDWSHVSGIQLGSPFTNPIGQLLAKSAHSFKGLDHGLNVRFFVPFVPLVWHNFAITVDRDSRTLLVAYSTDRRPIKAVNSIIPNPTVAAGAMGDLHFGVLKLPLVDPEDSPTDQSTTEGLFYSGVSVERRNPLTAPG
ncbi:hypothetical protein DFH09DRAFT_1164257 [Mycena vulgaris]|nr:hypothetical protein DFH09DRAFT_1164257 [Mycena vulgaris]